MKKNEVPFLLIPPSPAQKVKFRLEGGSKEVMLLMVDATGTEWAVAGVTKDGHLIRYGRIPNDVGLQTEGDGYISVTDEP